MPASIFPSVRTVSTHSRLKAAGHFGNGRTLFGIGFNTQPPEGGWRITASRAVNQCGFNTQPPEGGWAIYHADCIRIERFNTQPPEGGWS